MSGPADVGGHHHVRVTEQAVPARAVTVAHHVQGGAGQPPGSKGRIKGIFIDQSLTGRVYEKRARFHLGEGDFVEQVFVLIRGPGVQRDEVGSLQQFVEGPHALDVRHLGQFRGTGQT